MGTRNGAATKASSSRATATNDQGAKRKAPKLRAVAAVEGTAPRYPALPPEEQARIKRWHDAIDAAVLDGTADLDALGDALTSAPSPWDRLRGIARSVMTGLAMGRAPSAVAMEGLCWARREITPDKSGRDNLRLDDCDTDKVDAVREFLVALAAAAGIARWKAECGEVEE
jgi:hypothetical protein